MFFEDFESFEYYVRIYGEEENNRLGIRVLLFRVFVCRDCGKSYRYFGSFINYR